MKPLALFILTACIYQAFSAQYYDLGDADELFNSFVQEYSKEYKNKIERELRFQIFKQSISKINEQNMNHRQGEAEFGINQFSDLMVEEFVKQYTGLKVTDDSIFCDTVKTNKDIPDAKAPEYFDWRDKRIVTRVKDQVDCGSCWAFSAVANLESQYALKHKSLVEFSEQQLVDCDMASRGCIGGYPSLAFKYLLEAGGAETEANYPYIGMDDTCNFNDRKIKAKVSECITYNLTSHSTVKQLLYKAGPISIALHADNIQHYKKGVLSAEACGDGGIDHAVLLVGYGSENGKDYWIVKNSWNESFGEKGYFRMERREGVNTCEFLNGYMASAVVA